MVKLFFRNMRYSMGLILSLLIFSLLDVTPASGSTFNLDEEAVFSLYYKMTGQDFDEQDLEDLCFQSGRPSFTVFKPSEMFMKHHLRQVKDRIEERMQDFKKNPIFIMTFKNRLIQTGKNSVDRSLFWQESDMPQPTPYINSEISEQGKQFITGKLNRIFSETPEILRGKPFNIRVSFRPEKISHRYQNRNIAQEDVFIPIRCVIFHPIKVEVLDKTMTIQGSGG